MVNMGLIEQFVFKKVKWESFKDFFALWKNVVEIIKYIFVYVRNYKKICDIEEELLLYDD